MLFLRSADSYVSDIIVRVPALTAISPAISHSNGDGSGYNCSQYSAEYEHNSQM